MPESPLEEPVQPTPELSPQHPSGPRNDAEKNWGLFTHLSSLVTYAGIPLGWFLGPLIMWLIKRDEIPFVDDQGKEAMNFNLSLTIYALGAAVIALVTLGIGLIIAVPVVFALFVGHIVFTILAAVAASRGENYRYPLTLRLIN